MRIWLIALLLAVSGMAMTGFAEETAVPEPREIDGYTLYGGGDANIKDNGEILLNGTGTDKKIPSILVKKLDAPQGIVAITATARHSGGVHRSIFIALGSSDKPGTFVIGGPWTGLKRNGIAQYDGIKPNPVDQHLPPTKFPLPAVNKDFTITLRVDIENKMVTVVVEGCEPVTRPLKVDLTQIDLVGVCVRGETKAAFKNLTVAEGAEAAKAAIEKAADEAGKWKEEAVVIDKDAPARGVLVEKNFAEAESVNDTGWTDNPYNRPPTALRVGTLPEGKVLSVDVPSMTELMLDDELPMRPGKVYRVDLTARIVGQVEQVIARMSSRKFQPVQWPLKREWSNHTVQVRSKGGKYRFQVRLMGVGTFQVKDYKITEMEDFDLPPVEMSYRGELLPNGDFALAHLDWNFRYPEREGIVAAKNVSDMSAVLKGDPDADKNVLKLPAGERSLLTSGTMLRLPYGRTYTITLRGKAVDGDVTAFLTRPGMAAVDNERFELKFTDGVAKVEFPMLLPQEGMVYEPVQLFGFRLRHLGRTDATFESISVREDGPGAPESVGPRIGIELLEPDEEYGRCIVKGESITARVRTSGLPADAGLVLTLSDETGGIVRRVPVASGDPAAAPNLVDTVIEDLPQGWFRVSAESPGRELTVVTDDLAVVLPADPEMQRTDYLGTHLGSNNNVSHLKLLADLGVRQVRVWELSWDSVQPERDGPIRIPDDLLDAYQEAGITPMVILGGTPRWATTMPKGRSGWREYAKYPPQNMADWEQYIRQVVTLCGDRVNSYEIWNEPNGHWLKKNPKDSRTLEEIYAELVKAAYPIIKEVNPNAEVVIGSCAGHPSFSIKSMDKYGAAKFCDALSYHAYGSVYSAGQGAEAFSYVGVYLDNKLKELGRPDLPRIDSESGLKEMEDGPAGAFDAMLLAKGLVARPAAKFSRYYFYNAVPRQYPGHWNFAMLFGFNDRPLVSMPMIATWDRLLGNAEFVENLGNDAEGRHLYRFKRNDGFEVIAAWKSQPDASDEMVQNVMPEAACIDALGRLLHGPKSEALKIGDDLRYFFPPALLTKLGLQQ